MLHINADFNPHAEVFSSKDLDKLRLFVAGFDYLFIDEAQRIPDIGINLKILHDNFPGLRILVTGSSSLDLANQVNEPLTVGGYSRNLRKEISKRQKIYFQDLGIRNALIEKFAPINLRDDAGRLWENFLI